MVAKLWTNYLNEYNTTGITHTYSTAFSFVQNAKMKMISSLPSI